MRRLALFLVGGAIWLLLLAIPALADNGPHVRGQANNAATGSCAACHRAHSGQDRDLLKAAPSQLCYTCHGPGNVGATTDVSDGVAYGDTATTHVAGPGGIPAGGGALRGGGFEYALIATGTLAAQPSGLPTNGSTLGRVQNIPLLTTSQAATSAHSVDGSPVTMWGAGAVGTAETGKADVELTCASCHDPHGNGQYRILKPTPDGLVVDSTVTAVKLNDATVKSYTTTNYGMTAQVTNDAAEVPLNTDGSAISFDPVTKTFTGTYLEASSRWCALCHTRYFGTTGAAGNKTWTEAGRADDTFTFLHATRGIVDPATSFASTPVATAQLNPLGDSVNGHLFSQIKTAGFVEVDRVTGLPTGWVVTSAPTIGSYGSGASLNRGVAIVSEVWHLPSGPSTPPSTLPADGATQVTSAIASATTSGQLLTSGAPRCLTCHVSHGSNANAGATTQLETSLVTGANLGSTLLRLDGRSVCQACHAK